MPDGTIKRLAQQMGKITMQSADRQMAYNTATDTVKSKWAIVAHPGACEWCLMYSSRGWAYNSDKTAEAQRHANCKCVVVADSDASNPSLAGYDPDELYRQWQDAVAARQARADGKSAGLPAEEALRATNPNYSPYDYAYSQNCQRCVVAYEANRRGILCEAGRRVRNDTIFTKGTAWYESFADAAGNTLKAAYQWEKAGIRQASQWATKFDSIIKARGWGNIRGIIRVEWKNGGAHVFNFETMGGTVHYYDAQVGKELALQDWLPYCKPTKTTFTRVDDLQLTANCDLCIIRK